MRYFVGVAITGEARKWWMDTTEDIALRCGLWSIQKYVEPHLTLYRPFDYQNFIELKSKLSEWTSAQPSPGSFSINGYGNFAGHAVYASVQAEEGIHNAVSSLKKLFSLLPKSVPEDYPQWIPHVTLAFQLTPEDLAKAWRYVQTLPVPEFTLSMKDITLFRAREPRGWEADSTFPFSP